MCSDCRKEVNPCLHYDADLVWTPYGVPSTDDELLKDMCASKHMSIDEIISEGNAFRSHYAAKVADSYLVSQLCGKCYQKI